MNARSRIAPVTPTKRLCRSPVAFNDGTRHSGIPYTRSLHLERSRGLPALSMYLCEDVQCVQGKDNLPFRIGYGCQNDYYLLVGASVEGAGADSSLSSR